MTNSPARLGVGVIGLGFMGQIHVRAYQAAAADGLPCELRAVCDPDPARLTGRPATAGNLGPGPGEQPLFDPARVRGHTQADSLLADPSIDLVSICTYTDTHVDLALRALKAGKHVLVEKPVAIGSSAVRTLANAARDSGRLCMPGMCMRFWPGWDWLRDRIRDGSLGSVRSVALRRLGSGPTWAADFYKDQTRSGGALWDLHIHDADFLYWCFGRPSSVTTTGAADHFTTLYRFASPTAPPHVTAEGGWDLAPGAGYRMRYLVTFQNATAEFHAERAPAVVLHRSGGSEPIAFGPLSAYELQIRHLVAAAAEGRPAGELRATLEEDAVAVAELLEAESRSLQTRRPVDL
jgi:predicted dehydrogenase